MHLTIAGIAALCILGIFFLLGCLRGLIREILSIVSIFLVMALMYFLSPYVSDFLMDNTGLYDRIETGCESFVKATADRIGAGTGRLSDQVRLVEELPLPKGLQDQLVENNTDAVYEALGVENFLDYLTAFLAQKVYGFACMLVSLFLASLAVGILGGLLDMASRIPGIREANRIGGGMIGLAKGFLIVWVCLVVLTVCIGTEWGSAGLGMVREDTILREVYDLTVTPLHLGEPKALQSIRG